MTQEIPKARAELDRTFRALLGVEGEGIHLPGLPAWVEAPRDMG